MAETIRIEIPIEAKDNTGAGVRSAQQKLMGLERDMQRMQQKFHIQKLRLLLMLAKLL